jgi:hypothetical protein
MGRGGAKIKVICASRRTDVPANKPLLDHLISALNLGAVTYSHPLFGPTHPVVYPVSDTDVVSWFSKDFNYFVAAWKEPESHAILARFKHHFSFTICGEHHSVLEPGLASSLYQRYQQLTELVEICKSLNQDPDKSILVRVDPISVYTLADSPGIVFDTLDHIPALTSILRALGLTRLHISFTQIKSFRRTATRLARIQDHIIVEEISAAKQQALLETKLLPFTTGISIETCTARDMVSLGIVKMGACVGQSDIESIMGRRLKDRRQVAKCAEMRDCSCYPFQDVGEKHVVCKHGCRYCFANPQIYDW